MKFKPTYNRILIKPIERQNGTAIYVSSEKEIYGLAEILDVGPTAGERNDKRYHNFSIGQVIVYHKGTAINVDIGGEKHTLLDDNNVIGLT